MTEALAEHQDTAPLSLNCVADGCARSPCVEAGSEGIPLCSEHDTPEYRRAFESWRTAMFKQRQRKEEAAVERQVAEAEAARPPESYPADDTTDVIIPPDDYRRDDRG